MYPYSHSFQTFTFFFGDNVTMKQVYSKKFLFLSIIYPLGCIFVLIAGPYIQRFAPKKIKYVRQFCQINITQEPSSSNRDVLLLFSSQYVDTLELCLKSLRESGSKCRVILLVTGSFTIDRRASKLLKALNVEIIPNCEDLQGRAFSPHMLRYEFEYQWLRKNSQNVDRIFHSDSLDVFFQSDPFTPKVQNNSLLFVVEPHELKSCVWNTHWAEGCYNQQTVQMLKNNFIVCSGSIMGGANQYIQLLELMFKQKEWSSCWGPSHDQPILNYLIWSGEIKNAGIQYDFTGCEGGFFTAQWCTYDLTIKTNQYNQIISEHGSTPSFVHQYNRIKGLTQILLSKCNVPTDRYYKYHRILSSPDEV